MKRKPYCDDAFALEWTIVQDEADIGFWNFYEEGSDFVEQGLNMNDFMTFLFEYFDVSHVNVIYVKKLNYFTTILSAYAGFDNIDSRVGFNRGKETVMRLFLKDISWIEFRNWDMFFEDEERGYLFLKKLAYCRKTFNGRNKNRLGLKNHFIYALSKDLWWDIAENNYFSIDKTMVRLRQSMCPQTEEEFNLYYEVYKGSYYFINPLYKGTSVPNVKCYDISSSHLGLMLRKKYPIGTATLCETAEQMQYVFEHDFCFIGRFMVKGLEPRYDMPFDLAKFGFCDDDGTWYLVLTDVHLRIFKKLFRATSVVPYELYYFTKNYLPKKIAEVIYELYDDKQAAKKARDSFFKQIFKFRAELVFGKSIQSPFYELHQSYNEEDNCFEPKEAPLDFEEIAKKLRTRQTLPYQVGIWTAAYSFEEEVDMILGIGLDKVVYGDTDSVKYVGKTDYIERHNAAIQREFDNAANKRCFFVVNDLGKWMPEKTCDLFKAIAPKWYLSKVDDTIEPTAAGANLNALTSWAEDNYSPFDNFHKGMCVNGLFKTAELDKEHCCVRTGTTSVISEALLQEMENRS